ncbi:MAG: hypothetical protein IRY94_18870 [Rhodospirillaceae bacterium]|nr:hypothetical protein [Rhodospirillaceae bacterium]
MDQARHDFVRLVDAVEAALAAAPAEAAEAFRAGLAAVRGAALRCWPEAAAFDLPVCRFWDVALSIAGPPALAAPLRTLGPRLVWTQNAGYRRSPVAAPFLDGYGYAVIAGPAAGAPGLAACETLALGVLLLGPGTHYPRHVHPAREVYLPLVAAEWQQGEGAWTSREAGAVIHHAPGVPHAVRSGETPLLAVYLWAGDLATPARLV